LLSQAKIEGNRRKWWDSVANCGDLGGLFGFLAIQVENIRLQLDNIHMQFESLHMQLGSLHMQFKSLRVQLGSVPAQFNGMTA